MSPQDHQKVKNILFDLSDAVINVETEHGNISKIIKKLDSAMQFAYTELYKIIDGREILKQKDEQKKHGHCC